jgi:prepilin signal peptidase PulO-like enzyme (type II secretory pathway)
MIVIFFVVGIIVGSFLGVVSWRIKTAEDIVFKRSYCPHCKKKIRWYDNIPLFSFIILAGQCRDCKKKISWEYPLIELATGLLFAAAAYKFFGAAAFGFTGAPERVFGMGDVIALSFLLFAISYLVIIFFHDLDFMLIPDVVVYPAMLITFLYQVYKYLQSPLGIWNLGSPVTSSLFAAFLAALFFMALIWISKGSWIGGGDVKLGFLLGLIVGWPKIIFVLFLAYMFGAVVSLLLIAFRLKTWKSQVPFAPFLVSAALLVLFFSDQIQFWANRYLDIGF